MALDRRSFISWALGLASAIGLVRPRPVGAVRQPSGSPSRNFEFAIVGAGLFGSAAARHLSTASESVALIGPAEPENHEAHEGVFASHYDASRLVRGVDPDRIWATLAQQSIARYRGMESTSGIPFYNEIGYLMVTPGGLGEDWFDLPAMREIANEMSIGVEDLDAASLQKRYPWLQFTPGSSGVLQAKGAGYIDPRGLLAAQQKIGEAQGMTLIRDEVSGIKQNRQRISIETASAGTLHANRVLLAIGAYSNTNNLLRRKIDIKVRATMLMETEVPADAPGDYPSTLYAKTDGEEDFWGLLMPPVRYADGHLYIKTMDGYYGPAPLSGKDALNAWNRGRGHEDHHRVLERALREVFPSLTVRSQRFKPCLITDTASHYPYIEMLDDRIGLVAGGNGKAAKSSDEIGRLAAEMIRTGNWPSSLPQAKFAARFA